MHGDEVRRRAFAEDKHCRVFYNYTRPQHTGFYEERAHLCKNKTHWNTKMQPEKRVFNWRTVCSEWRWCEEKWWEPRAFGLPNCLVFNFFFFEILALLVRRFLACRNSGCLQAKERRTKERPRERPGEQPREQPRKRTDGGSIRKSLQTFQKLKFNYWKRKQSA